MQTAQQFEDAVKAAREQAIERIKAAMLPGAQALCDARQYGDDYWLKEVREVAGGVGTHGVSLEWYSQGKLECRQPNGVPYEGNRPGVCVIAQDSVTPELLQETYDIAVKVTQEIIAKAQARLGILKKRTDKAVAAFDAVGR